MRFETHAENPVHAAIKAVEGPSNLAKAMTVSRETVRKWRKKGRFPEHRLEKLQEVTGLSLKELTHASPVGEIES